MVFILFVRLYQVTLRPFVGGFCRFQPTCSDYSIEAIQKYGAIKGGWENRLAIASLPPLWWVRP